MKPQIFKPVLVGLAIGTLFYFTPFFFLRGFLFFLIIASIFRLILFRRGGWRHRAHLQGFTVALADNIRTMSAEEYESFKNRIFYNDGCYSREKQKPE
ncbi:MAG: hypothetical protein ABIS36_13400 [Chryseolinea sp.]